MSKIQLKRGFYHLFHHLQVTVLHLKLQNLADIFLKSLSLEVSRYLNISIYNDVEIHLTRENAFCLFRTPRGTEQCPHLCRWLKVGRPGELCSSCALSTIAWSCSLPAPSNTVWRCSINIHYCNVCVWKTPKKRRWKELYNFLRLLKCIPDPQIKCS